MTRIFRAPARRLLVAVAIVLASVPTGCGLILGIDPDGARVGTAFGDGAADAIATTDATETGDGSVPPSDGSAPSAPPSPVIACGTSHTCALTEAGKAKCWGDNASGHLDLASCECLRRYPDGRREVLGLQRVQSSRRSFARQPERPR